MIFKKPKSSPCSSEMLDSVSQGAHLQNRSLGGISEMPVNAKGIVQGMARVKHSVHSGSSNVVQIPVYGPSAS